MTDLSDLIFSPYADRIDRVSANNTFKFNTIPQRRIAGMPNKDTIDKIIDLSARDMAPKEIAEQLGLERQAVYAVRSQWSGSIDARRKALAGLNIDGTPATVTHKPEGSVPVQKAKELTAEEAFDQIMQTIEPKAKDVPGPVEEPTPDEAFKEALQEIKERPATIVISTPDGLQIRSIELRGVAGAYGLTADGVDFLDGAIDRVNHDQLPGFIHDLTAIQRFAVGWGLVANG